MRLCIGNKTFFFNLGVQERCNNAVNKPWFGFAYGSFIPHFGFIDNGTWQWSFYWLFFHGSIDMWRHRITKEGMKPKGNYR